MLQHRRFWYGLSAGVLVVGAALLVATGSGHAQIKKGKTRTAETKYLMRGIMSPNCGALAKLLKDDGPTNDKGWEAAACHASVLNELSYIVMDDGRCPDKKWAGAAKTLQECSGKVLEAVNAKNLEEAQTAFKALTGACAACHTAHKKQ